MDDFRPLWRIQICHEYCERETDGVIDVRIGSESSGLMRNRLLFFKRESSTRWALLGNVDGHGVDGERDVLWFEFVLRDADFLYYTEWENYNPDVAYELDLSGCEGRTEVVRNVQTIAKKKPGILFTGKLKLSEEMYQRARKGEICNICLDFKTKEMYWEYLLIPRKTERLQSSLLLEEQKGELLFSEPETFYADFVNQPVWRCVSRSTIKMKEDYHYRLDLWEIFRKEPEVKRKIVKGLECPVPGQFHDLKGNYLRKIVYF